MNAPTLVITKHAQVGSRQFQHGEELPPNLIPPQGGRSLARSGLVKGIRSRPTPIALSSVPTLQWFEGTN